MFPWIHCWDSSMITVAFVCTALERNSEFKTKARFLNYTNTFKFHNELNTWCWKVWKHSLNAKLRLSFRFKQQDMSFLSWKRRLGLPRNRTYLIIVATTELRLGSCSINELNHLKEQHTRATWHSTKTEIFYKCPSELDCLIYKVLFSTEMIMKPKLYKQYLTLVAQSSFNIRKNVINLFCCELCDCLKQIFTGCRFLPFLLPWRLTVSCPTRYNIVFRNIYAYSLQWLWF